MNDDLLPIAQHLLERDDHERLHLGKSIPIKGTEASFESGKFNVEVVVAPATATFYVYVDKVKLAASISSASLQNATVDAIWITVLADHRRAYMEVSWIPPVNGDSNFAAIIKLKGPDRRQELSSQESESEDEEVGFGGQLEDNTTPPDGVGANVQATMKQKAPEPKQELSADESKSQECNVTANTTTGNLKEMIQENTQMPLAEQRLICNPKQLEENITPPDSVGSNVAAAVKHKGPKLKPERFFDETQSQDEKAGSEKSYQIFVKHDDGKTKTYDVTVDLTVVELKQMIEERCDLKPAEQRLVYGPKQLEDDKTLGHYGIKIDSTIHLAFRMKGG